MIYASKNINFTNIFNFFSFSSNFGYLAASGKINITFYKNLMEKTRNVSFYFITTIGRNDITI